MRTIFFRKPNLSPQQLFLLAVAIVLFVGYTLLEKKSLRADSLVHAEHHQVTSKVIVTSETKSQLSEPSLTYGEKDFFLQGKPLRILSGALHYFRVVPQYWKDRLVKLKAMGLNTVETYVPWNAHEEVKGHFKFDGNLDISAFIKLAKELGLYVILRPGPYICSEWDFGGLPSWLLSDPHMEPRSMYPPFIEAVDQFYKRFLPILVPLQFSKGGPIIAFQLENEYGSYASADVDYMQHLKMIMINGGITELLFTSDNHSGLKKEFLTLQNVLKTINVDVQPNVKQELSYLQEIQPDKPVLIMEYWVGWFDLWGNDKHHDGKSAGSVARVLGEILEFGASFNLYMFHGGTNFGFMNGANGLRPTTTSYDYDAPLSEAGDMTPKYRSIKDAIKQHAPEHSLPKNLPQVSENSSRKDYGKVSLQQFMSLTHLLSYQTPIESGHVMPMEQLRINNNGGQGYGFILYQTELPHYPKEIVMEQVLDRAQILLDSILIQTYDASTRYESPVVIKVSQNHAQAQRSAEPTKHKLEILVENMGRTNFVWDMKRMRKGITGKVTVDGLSPTKWRIYPLQFKPQDLASIKEKGKWDKVPVKGPIGPFLYNGTFKVSGGPRDTFLDMANWNKGVCFINGHNLGRYWERGPQRTLYVPAPWLRTGDNELIILELHSYMTAAEVSFRTSPFYRA